MNARWNDGESANGDERINGEERSAGKERARPLVIGVDAGGTKTRAAAYLQLAATAGTSARFSPMPVAEATAGPANALQGFDAAVAAVSESVRACLASVESAYPGAECLFLAIGMAGAQTEEMIERLQAVFQTAFGIPCRVMSDAALAFEAALGGGDGILVIAGTGSIAWGRKDGRMARRGGWGHLLGDEGSGYAIATSGIRAALHDWDDGLGETPLAARLREAWSEPALRAVVERVYRVGKAETASLSRVVEAAADNGDDHAIRILEEAGEALADMVARLADDMKLDAPAIACSGGVLLRAKRVRNAFQRSLGKRLPGARIQNLMADPTAAVCTMLQTKARSDLHASGTVPHAGRSEAQYDAPYAGRREPQHDATYAGRREPQHDAPYAGRREPQHDAQPPAAGRSIVLNGLDRLDEFSPVFTGRRIGLVTGPTGLDNRLVHGIDLFMERFRLVSLFSPEHGLYGAAQAGDLVASSKDPRTGLPVHSLYGERKEPDGRMLEGLDLIVFDMQDVGVRWFTYLYTLSHLMRGCAREGIPVVVLDRVNPLGGLRVEGNLLDPRFRSFVGEHEMPVLHGFTAGEFAQWVNEAEGIGCSLTVVPCGGWRRSMTFRETGLPWVMPSPNMPTTDTVRCYAGTCLFEGTNLSEGRGTTRPFEIVGAPFVDERRLADEMNGMAPPGVRFRAVRFSPTFSKHAGQACGGVQLHVQDESAFEPHRTGLHLLAAIRRQCPEFAFLHTEKDGWFVDRLAGTDAMRAEAFDPDAFLEAGRAERDRFDRRRTPHLLYRP